MSSSTTALFLIAIFALVIVPNVDSIRCYDFTSTSHVKNSMKTWIDCPADAQFCYKSYLESRDMNNNKNHVEGRACGSSNLCIQDGCVGTKTDKACCCRGELCNSGSSTTIFASILTLITVYFFNKN